jgi:hypothetical protein
METIYDHNPTKEELHYVGLDLPAVKKIYHLISQDGHYAKIAALYRFRKNKQKIDEYLDKIKDDGFKWETGYSIYHYARESDRVQ